MAKKIDFDKLPKAQQRVIIAKDLIARLNAKTFTPMAGVYFRANIDTGNGDAQLQSLIAKIPCRGCQIGGMFACAVDRHNALQLKDLDVRAGFGSEKALDDGEMRDYLGRWFSAKTLQDVEAVFKCDHDSDGRNFYHLARFHAAARMRMIAKNIIANKGTFKPAQILKLAKAQRT